MTNNLDTKYAELVARLQTLTDELDTFLHSTNDSMWLGSRPVKTVAGALKELFQVRALQKIVDHATLSDAQLDDTITEGMLTRVWGETDPALLGVYKKQFGVLTKIGYADLYDLTQP